MNLVFGAPGSHPKLVGRLRSRLGIEGERQADQPGVPGRANTFQIAPSLTFRALKETLPECDQPGVPGHLAAMQEDRSIQALTASPAKREKVAKRPNEGDRAELIYAYYKHTHHNPSHHGGRTKIDVSTTSGAVARPRRATFRALGLLILQLWIQSLSVL